MKVLHVDTGKGWRGGQQQVLWLMEGLRRRGIEQALMAPAGSPLAERMRARGFAVTELNPRTISLGNTKKLLQGVPQFDLTHAHDSGGHTLAWLAGAGKTMPSRQPLVVSRRVAFPIRSLGRIKYRAADAYLAVSEYVGGELRQAGVPPQKIRVVYDGVEAPAAPPDAARRAEFRRRHGVSDADFLIGTLTALAPEKCLHTTVDLLAALPPTTRFWVGRAAADAGESGAETALRAYAAERGVSERFRLLFLPPEGTEFVDFLDALDLFLYLSQAEGLGSAILLAMAHELPVVASHVGGIPEIVRHGQTGLLTENTAADLQQKVESLRNAPEMRQRLAAAGRAFVLAHATSDIMTAKTEAIYRELLQGSGHDTE